MTVPDDISVQNSSTPSEPLQIAIASGDLCLCQRLVREGENIHAGFFDCSGCTPLLYALHLDHTHIAKYLLSQGATIIGRTCQRYMTYGYTVYHYAAWRGDVHFMRDLLSNSQDDISQHCHPIHPLHLAILNNNIDCTKLLLDDTSSEASLPNSQKQAKSRPGTRNVPLLHPCEGVYDALHLANLKIQCQSAIALLRGDSKVNSHRNYHESSPLHLAAIEGYVPIAGAILTCGSLVDCTNAHYETPLHKACARGRNEMVRLLLDWGKSELHERPSPECWHVRCSRWQPRRTGTT